MVKRKNKSKPSPKIWQDIVPASMLPKSRLKKPIRTVEIKISLPHFFASPKFTRFKKKLHRIPKTAWLIGTGIIVAGIIGLLAYSQISSPESNIFSGFGDRQADGDKPAIVDTGGTTPDYRTISPTGKDIDALGGWVRVSPADRNPVFAYADRIGNTPINVSQQPLPPGFETDTSAQVDMLAIGYNANEKITVGGTSVHIGTSAKGPQSVIFTKDDLLILIKSSAKISNDSWAAYISSLQ